MRRWYFGFCENRVYQVIICKKFRNKESCPRVINLHKLYWLLCTAELAWYVSTTVPAPGPPILAGEVLKLPQRDITPLVHCYNTTIYKFTQKSVKPMLHMCVLCSCFSHFVASLAKAHPTGLRADPIPRNHPPLVVRRLTVSYGAWRAVSGSSETTLLPPSRIVLPVYPILFVLVMISFLVHTTRLPLGRVRRRCGHQRTGESPWEWCVHGFRMERCQRFSYRSRLCSKEELICPVDNPLSG